MTQVEIGNIVERREKRTKKKESQTGRERDVVEDERKRGREDEKQ